MPDTSHSMTTEAARAANNGEDFAREFDNYSSAAVPLYLIRTREHLRAAQALQDYAISEETTYKLWQCNKGWLNFPDVVGPQANEDYRKPVGTAIDSTADPIKALAWLASHEQPGIFVMIHPHSRLDNNIIQQWMNDIAYRGITQHKQRLVLIVPEDVTVPNEIEQNVHIMNFRPPAHSELRAEFELVLDSIDEDSQPNFSDDQIDVLVQNGIGMTAQEFGTACSLAAIGMQPSASIEEQVNGFVAEILKQKIQAVKKTNILTIMPPVDMEAVGGMDLLKRWLASRARGYSTEARDFGLAIPKGMLAVGPPGSGKSLFAKAVSSVFRVPLVVLDIGKVFDKYVGNSEAKMRAILQMIEDMAPCVLLVDEVDKGFAGMSGGGGDGGTTQRVLGTFLTWMQERDSETKPVFVVMTANNVTGLPPELFRKGRIDEIFAVTFPSDVERAAILKIHLAKRGHELSEADLRRVSEATQNFVGAELEAVVTDGLYTAFDADDPQLTADILIQQARSTKSLFDTFPDKVRPMLEWAKNNAKPASSGMSFDMDEIAKGTPSTGQRLLTPRKVTGAPRPMRQLPKGGRTLDG